MKIYSTQSLQWLFVTCALSPVWLQRPFILFVPAALEAEDETH